MLKNKFKVITLLMVILLSLMIPIVRAENEVSTEYPEVAEATESVGNDAIEQTENNETENSMKKHDVYIAGDNVTIDYIVDGNAFIIANTVTINSQIGGDAFILAKTVNIGEQAYIFSNLFTTAETINISGIVYDLYTACNELNINGYIYRDIKVVSDTININGVIGRNAYVSADSINFMEQSTKEDQTSTSRGTVNGNFNYTSSNEISIPEGSVAGEVKYSKLTDEGNNTTSISSYLLSLGGFIATILIICLLCLWLAPKFVERATDLIKNKTLKVYSFGILTPIVAVILFILLCIIGITVKIAFILLGLLIIAFAISTAFFVITINELICAKFKIEKNNIKLGILILTSIFFWLIALIPYVKVLVNLVAYLGGLGILVLNILPSKKETRE